LPSLELVTAIIVKLCRASVSGGKMPQDQTERAEAAAAMHRLLAGGWVAQIIHTAAELGLADHFGEEAQDVASLANATATNPPSLSRLLRALAAVGIVHETDDRRYTLTPVIPC
jgi:DNA-binding HxlR family transcriptional regulator